MAYMFSSCFSLTEIDVSNFETGEVTNMEGMFSNCSGLEILDLSNFDTTKVEEMACMLYSNRTDHPFLARVIIGSSWNPSMTESATGYNGTFEVKNN